MSRLPRAGMRLRELLAELRILPGGSGRLVTTLVPQDSTPSLPTWRKLTCWSGLEFAVWPWREVQIHVATCESASRPRPQNTPLSTITSETPGNPWAEHRAVLLPSPQHSRAPLGPPTLHLCCLCAVLPRNPALDADTQLRGGPTCKDPAALATHRGGRAGCEAQIRPDEGLGRAGSRH